MNTPQLTKYRNFAVFAVAVMVSSQLFGQNTGNKNAPQEKGENPDLLYTQVFVVPPTFLTSAGGGATPAADPFADPVATKTPKAIRPTAKSVLEAVGVKFGEGATAIYNPASSKLIVRNTADELDLVEVFLDTGGPGSAKQIPILVEYVEIDFALWNEWIFENRIAIDGTELRKQAQKWRKEGKADIVESILVTARSGQRAKKETVHEFIYPTEVDPAEIPNVIDLTGKDAVAPRTGVTPTAFETRKVGTTLEVDPVLGADSITIDINLAPEIIQEDGFSHWPHEDSDLMERISMPIFHAFRATTGFTTLDGRYALVGACRPLKAVNPNRAKPYVLIFARGDVSVIQPELEEVKDDPKRIPYKPE